MLQNLQSRVTDLQGQISRLNAEKLRAQEDAAVARSAKADHEREFEGLEAELQNLRSTSLRCSDALTTALVKTPGFDLVCWQLFRRQGCSSTANGVDSRGHCCGRGRAATTEAREFSNGGTGCLEYMIGIQRDYGMNHNGAGSLYTFRRGLFSECS